jgi:hypothetical protein
LCFGKIDDLSKLPEDPKRRSAYLYKQLNVWVKLLNTHRHSCTRWISHSLHEDNRICIHHFSWIATHVKQQLTTWSRPGMTRPHEHSSTRSITCVRCTAVLTQETGDMHLGASCYVVTH